MVDRSTANGSEVPVAMFLPAFRIATAAGLLVVTACNPPPWTVNRSPDSITLRWYADETDIAAAQAVADVHCRSFGKAAALASNEQSGSIQIAEYRCR
jgi:hypothetical protein